MCCGTACAGSPSSQPLPEQIRLPAVILVDDPCPDLTGDDAHAEGGAASPALAGDGAAGFNAHRAMTFALTKSLRPETGFKAWR